MNQLKHKLLGVALSSVVLAACNGGSTTQIAAPANGGQYETAPSQFMITYSSQPANMVITLNGFPVQEYFSFGSGSATASGNDLKDFLVQGQNTLQINPKSFGPKTVFYYDSTGPNIIITSVSSSTNPIQVHGELRDPAGATSLTVNGTPATVTSYKYFTANVDPASVYTFVAKDTMNHTSTIKYAKPSTEFTETIKARVGQSAMDSIVPIVTAQIKDLLLDSDQIYASGVNPLLERAVTWTGAFGEPYGLDADLTKMSLATINMKELTIRPNNDGTLYVDVDINDLYVDVLAYIYNGLIPGVTELPLGLAIGSANAKVIAKVGVADRKLQLSIEDLQLTVDKTRIRNLLGIGLSDYDPPLDLLSTVVNALSGVIGDMVANKIAKMMEDQMDFVITTNLYFGNVGLGMDTALESLTTQNGNIVVGLGGQVRPLPKDIGVPPVLGSLYTSTPVPDPQLTLGNITAIVGGNFVNQAVMAAFQAGMFNISLANNQLKLGTQITDTSANGTTRIRVIPSSVPMFTFGGDNIAVANVEMYNFTVMMEKKVSGTFVPMVDMALDIRVPVKMGINDENAMTIDLLTDPEIEVLSLNNGYGFNISTDVVNNIIDTAVPLVLNQIGHSLLTIKLPTVGGYGITPEEISTVGSNNENLSFSGTIIVPN